LATNMPDIRPGGLDPQQHDDVGPRTASIAPSPLTHQRVFVGDVVMTQQEDDGIGSGGAEAHALAASRHRQQRAELGQSSLVRR